MTRFEIVEHFAEEIAPRPRVRRVLRRRVKLWRGEREREEDDARARRAKLDRAVARWKPEPLPLPFVCKCGEAFAMPQGLKAHRCRKAA